MFFELFPSILKIISILRTQFFYALWSNYFNILFFIIFMQMLFCFRRHWFSASFKTSGKNIRFINIFYFSSYWIKNFTFAFIIFCKFFTSFKNLFSFIYICSSFPTKWNFLITWPCFSFFSMRISNPHMCSHTIFISNQRIFFTSMFYFFNCFWFMMSSKKCF